MARVRSIGLWLVLVLTAATAQAAPRTAREHYREGLSHYNLSEWQAALDEFREAYRLKPDPAFLYNIAQCHRQLHDYREAANFYRAFRRESADAPASVDTQIAEMERLATQSEQREAEAAAGRKREEEAKAAPPPPAPVLTPTEAPAATVTATAPRERPLTRRPWFWAAVGGGVVVVAAAVTLGVVFGTPPKNPSLTFGAVQGN